MANIPKLNQLQIGKETVWGTAVAPTAKLMGIDPSTSKITPINEAMQHEKEFGSLAPNGSVNLTKIGGTASIPGECTYEDLPYWFDGLFDEETPTGSDPYTYAYEAPSSAIPSSNSFTLVHGQGADVYALNGALLNQLVISGQTGEDLKFQADFIGEDVTADTLESLSDRAVNYIMAQQLALYIDAWDGTIGTTAVATTFFSFELTINANREVYYGFGDLTPANYRNDAYTGELKMSLEFDATSQGYFDDAIDGTSVFQRQVRLKASNGASLDAQFDFAGSALEVPPLYTESNGVITLDFAMTGTDNTTLGNWFKATIINGVATLP